MLRDIFDGTTYEIPTRPSGPVVDSTNLGRHEVFRKEVSFRPDKRAGSQTLITMIENGSPQQNGSTIIPGLPRSLRTFLL